MATAVFFSFIGSMILCMALIPPLTASAWRYQFVDVPRDRHAHDTPVAKVGGIAFAVATFAAVLLWAPKDQVILASLLGGAVIFAFGVWDDIAHLDYRVKFLGQVLAASLVVALADVRITAVPFTDEVLLPEWLAIPLTLVVIVALTNAVNLADGLDGLAGGLSLMSFAGIAYLAYRADEPVLVLLMMSVLGGLLGFLRFNTYPARIFMGDAGSQFLGHYLAVAAILLTDSTRTAYSPLLALFLWGVPLLDTAGVIWQRLREGRSPFVGDRNHLHHKLLGMGWSHRQAVTAIYALHGAMVACAYLFRWESDGVLLALYLVCAAVVLSVFAGSGQALRLPFGAPIRPVTASLAGKPSKVGAWSLAALELLVPMYLLASVAIPQVIPRDVGLAATGLLGAVTVGLFVDRGAAWLVRAGLYIGSTVLVYYGETMPRPVLAGLTSLLNTGFIALALLVFLSIRNTSEQRFQTTPLDYVILVLAVALSFLPGLAGGEVPVGMMAAKLVVLFFAFEVLLYARSSSSARLGWVSVGMLGALVLRASWW